MRVPAARMLAMAAGLGLLSAAALAQSGTWSVSGDDHRRTLDDARNQERGVLDELNDLDRALHEVQTEIDGLQDRALALDENHIRHADELASAEATLGQREAAVSQRLGALYRLHRRGLARIVFGAEDPAELRRRSKYLASILAADLAHLRTLNEARASKGEAMRAVQASLDELGALRAELQVREADLRDQRARRLEMLGELRSTRELALRAMAEDRSARRDLSGRLYQGTPGQSVDPTPPASASTGSFRAAYGKLPWPTTGTLARGFGPYRDPLTGGTSTSDGFDIHADYGTPFRAVAAGTVKVVDFIPGYGQTVALEHGPYTTVYAHANGTRVSKGQRVDRGDVLGWVGNSGLTHGSGYMLTFEIRYNGTPQDPKSWLSPR